MNTLQDDEYERLSKSVPEPLAAALVFDSAITLPELLDHDAYAVFLRLHQWVVEGGCTDVRIYCDGNGGDGDVGIAIASLVASSSRYIGILVGAAYSAHVTVFASCARRFVYPNASIGVHRSYLEFSGPQTMTTNDVAMRAAALERVNDIMATVLANASDLSVVAWHDLLVDTTSSRILPTRWIIAHKMAEPIS